MSVMDMQDRELLELSAKAFNGGNPAWTGEYAEAFRRGFMSFWNPLEDNSDAFMLAFHLGMDVDMGSCRIIFDEDDKELEFDLLGGDIGCVRLAIVRAAAEIGKQMPC